MKEEYFPTVMFPAPILMGSLMAPGISKQIKLIVLFENNMLKAFNEKNSLEILSEKFADNIKGKQIDKADLIKSNYNYPEEFLERVESILNSASKLADEFLKKDFKEMDKEKFEKNNQLFYSKIAEIASTIAPGHRVRTYDRPIEYLIEKGKTKQEADTIIMKAMFPKEKSYALSEKRDFLKLVEEIKSNPENKNAYQSYLGKWAWVSVGWGAGYVIDLEMLKKMVKDEIENRNIEKELKEAEKTYKEKLEEKEKALENFDEEHKAYLRMLEVGGYLRIQTKYLVGKLLFSFMPALKIMAKKLNLDYEDLICLRKEELELNAEEIKNINLEQRRKLVVFKLIYGNLEFFEGLEAERIKQEVEVKESKLTELKGIPAAKGKVRGNVNIIMNSKDLNKFKKGEILVAPETNPELMPAITKASAILTELGGITSHAAIVSRELGKPCIVNIKGLLDNVKDGDEVEMDGEKGTIKILK